MPSGPHPSDFVMTGRVRVFASVLALALFALLATAAYLEPSSTGIGTHQQLGLGECFVMKYWQVRCPSCGMTTAWSRLLDGDFRGALAANAGGALLCVAALIAAPWLLASTSLGRWCYLRPTFRLVLPLFALLVLVILLDWMRHTGVALLVQSLTVGT